MKTTLSIIFLFFVTLTVNAQMLDGKVIEDINAENTVSVPFVNVFWLGTTIATTTDETGDFSIKKPKKDDLRLVVFCEGYISDTITVNNDKARIIITLHSVTKKLDELVVHGKHDATSINTTDIQNSQSITSDGLERLACCSLADSFENNSAVDVGYTDAVTGAKQIQMLGLAGIYSQILIENQPFIRVLSSMYGLNYVPGPWLDAISISKGTSSVSYGSESITGQINIEIKKPESDEKLYIEYFTNDYLKQEFNLNSSFKINDKLSSIILLHGSTVKLKVDRNNDKFLDVPLSDLIIVSNRFFYNSGKKIKGRFDYDFIYEDRVGGQTDFNKDDDFSDTNDSYGVVLKTKRLQVSGKIGSEINNEKNSSVGFRGNFVFHEQDSKFGLRKYDPVQKSVFLTALFNSDIFNKNNKISTGFNFCYDNLEENFIDKVLLKEEHITGAFAEYTFNDKKKWSVIAGLRADYNNNHGFFLVPRFHAKYTFLENSAFRISAGRGLRSSNVISEHTGLLATSRDFIFSESLELEDALNYGISYTQKIFFGNNKKMTINLDFYRTDFRNKVVIDLEQNTGSVFFYNLNGKSFSNSFQTDIIIHPFKDFDITFAYRFNDAQTTVNNELISNPLVAEHKSLLAFHYSVFEEKWNFSFTTQYNGKSRLPNTKNNPQEYILPEYSNDFFIFHSQITRKFKKMEFYIGVENITNYKQKNPILSSDNPFGDYFDSSIIYAPILGRQFNFGFRLIIK